jgi:hypothetical protein
VINVDENKKILEKKVYDGEFKEDLKNGIGVFTWTYEQIFNKDLDLSKFRKHSNLVKDKRFGKYEG